MSAGPKILTGTVIVVAMPMPDRSAAADASDGSDREEHPVSEASPLESASSQASRRVRIEIIRYDTMAWVTLSDDVPGTSVMGATVTAVPFGTGNTVSCTALIEDASVVQASNAETLKQALTAMNPRAQANTAVGGDPNGDSPQTLFATAVASGAARISRQVKNESLPPMITVSCGMSTHAPNAALVVPGEVTLHDPHVATQVVAAIRKMLAVGDNSAAR
jgi:hypothetical protein